MRISVAFHNATILVPCGDGSCTVSELINKAITRYKKHVNKPADYEVKVKNLRMANGSGYIDDDDIVSEVLNDMEFVIADFEESNLFDNSSMTSYDSVPNFAPSRSFIGTAPSITSVDNEEQTPVLDRPHPPYSLLDEANLSEHRPRKWSESQSESEPRESPAAERLPLPIRDRPLPRQRASWSSEHFSSTFSRPWETSLDVMKRKGYPFVARRMEAFANRPRYPQTSSLLEGEDHDVSLYRSFGQHNTPSRYRPGSLYRPRSQDILGTDDYPSSQQPSFGEGPESDVFNEPANYYLSQPAFGQFESTRNHYLPSGFSLSQPGPARHVSFSEKASELGPRDLHDRPSSLSSTTQSAMRTVREEPGEFKSSDDERPPEDVKSESESTMSDKEYGPFNRNTRKSIRDGPVLEQWANAVETKNILDDQDSEPTINGDEIDLQDTSTDQGLDDGETSLNTSTLLRSPSPSPPPNFGEVISSETEDLENEEEEDLSNICIIELHKGNRPLGLQLTEQRTPDGRDAGIFIAALDENGFAAESKNLQINDRILACNGADFTKISNDKAIKKLNEMMDEPVLRIALSRPVVQVVEKEAEWIEGAGPDNPSPTNTPNVPVPANTSSNTRQLGRLHTIELVKGDRGLGFALTSRDVAANDGERLIYIKSITPGGVAFEDGRLKMGDRLLKVNDEDISGYTRPEVADLLRTCQGRITLTVSRQGGASSDDEEGEGPSSETPVAIGKSVLTLNIAMADSSSAELGITVQGRVNNSSHAQATNFGGDAGVYVSTVIPGCAAAYDGRLLVGDQLLSVNGQSLVGKTNDDALETLRKALAQNRPEVQLVIARKGSKPPFRRSESQLNEDHNEIQPSREVGIDVGPSTSTHSTSGYGCSQNSFIPSQGSYGHSQGSYLPSQNSYGNSQGSYLPSQDSVGSLGSPSILRKDLGELSQDSIRSDHEIVLKDPLVDSRHTEMVDARKGEYSVPKKNSGQQVSKVSMKVPASSSSSSLSQNSDRGLKYYSVADQSSTHTHAVLSPSLSDSGHSQSEVVSPPSVDVYGSHSPARRKGSFGRSSLTHGKPPSPSHSPRPIVQSKYAARISSSPLASPSPPNGHAPQRHMSFTERRSSVIEEEDTYHSTTIPRAHKEKPRTEEVKTDSPEALGPSDDESNSAFQRDGPGRISIKKGKSAPKTLSNVPLMNAEPKLEGDGLSLVGHEMSRSMDDLLTQESRDTGVDMSLSVDSLRTMSSQGYSQEDPTGLTRNEGRNSLRRAMDKTDRCSSEDRDPQVEDIRGVAVSQYVAGDCDEKKKKEKKKKFFKIFSKKGKKSHGRADSIDDGKIPAGQYTFDEKTGEIRLRAKSLSGSKLSPHQRFSLSVLDTYDDQC